MWACWHIFGHARASASMAPETAAFERLNSPDYLPACVVTKWIPRYNPVPAGLPDDTDRSGDCCPARNRPRQG
jgi:hypothetical protein